jgi:molybdenum cofactor cytidylyltransferase
MLNLARALRLTPQTRLALVGAGGKSSALFQAARQIAPPVLLTTTTHLAVEQARQADRWVIAQSPEDINLTGEAIARQVILFTGVEDGSGRTLGVAGVVLDAIRQLADQLACPLLIEADGSRRLPLKTPAEYEPAIPAFSNTVVVSAGLSGLGKPLDDNWVHRPERFAALSGLEIGGEVSVDALVKVLSHPLGGLKNIPAGARRILLLNQADTAELQAQGRSLADQLLPFFDSVLVASLQPGILPAGLPDEPQPTGGVIAVHERIGGVILAAGGSVRFGQPKLLLPWKGETVIRSVARSALSAGLDPVVVVAGDQIPAIRQELAGLTVLLAPNPDWEQGQITSVKAGLWALPENCQGAVFFLGDQPQIPPILAQTLIEAHAASLAPIVAPLVDGQRGNPVLFDRDTFKDLTALRGDVGGRPLFAKYPVEWVPWHDPGVLLDIDTPEDYQRLSQDCRK